MLIAIQIKTRPIAQRKMSMIEARQNMKMLSLASSGLLFASFLLADLGLAASKLPPELESNPLLQSDFKLDDVKVQHFIPAWEYYEAIARADLNRQIKKIVDYQLAARHLGVSEAIPYEAAFKDLVSIEKLTIDLEKVSRVLNWFDNNSNRKPIQAVQRDLTKRFQDFTAEFYQNPTLFEFINNLYEVRDKFKTFADRTLIETYYETFISLGAKLHPDQQAELNALQDELSKTEQKFENNLQNSANANKLNFRPEELVGVPSDKLPTPEKNGLILVVPHSDLSSNIFKYCTDEEIRKKVYESEKRVGAFPEKFSNLKLVERNIQIRYQIANLLGYATPAEQTFRAGNNRLAGSIENINKIYSSWITAYLPYAEKEEAEFLSRFPEASKDWNRAYYRRIQFEENFKFDEEKLRDYFEWNRTSQLILDHFGELFDLEIVPVKGKNRLTTKKGFFEWDVFDKQQKNKQIARLVVDPIERPGRKASGAHQDIVQLPFGKKSKNRPHIVDILMNMPKPLESGVVLMPYDGGGGIITFAHELGHAFNQILGKSRHPAQFGTNVPADFVEIPSMIMERFVMLPEFLREAGVHYQTGERIPEEWLTKLDAINKHASATVMVRQIAYGQLDLGWFTAPTAPSPEVFQNLNSLVDYSNSLAKLAALEGKTAFGAVPTSLTFHHLFGRGGGYVLNYYGYNLSKFGRANGFQKFENAPNGPWSSEVGRKWRKEILSIGSSKDVKKAFEKFLGGPAQIEPMLREDGIPCEETTRI